MRPICVRTSASGRRVARAVTACSLVLLLAPDSLFAQTDQSLRIVPLVRGDQVLVSFELTDGFTDEVKAAIRSGLKTTFTYTVDLRLDVAGWVDRTIGTAIVTNSVEYDNLTRRHEVMRLVDGQLEDTRVIEGEDRVGEWMTRLRRLPLFQTSLLEPNREYYVRVRAISRPGSGWSLLWPFGSSTSAQVKFTFIR